MHQSKRFFLTLCLMGVTTWAAAQDAPPSTPPAKTAGAACCPACTCNQRPVAAPVPPKSSAPKPSPSGKFEKFPICKVYNVSFGNDRDRCSENISKFVSEPSLKGFVAVESLYDENSSGFVTKGKSSSSYNVIVWDGYLPVKKPGKYAFKFVWKEVGKRITHGRGAMILAVGKDKDGKRVIPMHWKIDEYNKDMQFTFSVDFPAGMNQVQILLCASNPRGLLELNPTISYKPADVVGGYRSLNPSMLFHKVKGEDW